jgi:hypothetical protein
VRAKKLALHSREQARRVYYGPVFEFTKGNSGLILYAVEKAAAEPAGVRSARSFPSVFLMNILVANAGVKLETADEPVDVAS